jgi:hypothetical protein
VRIKALPLSQSKQEKRTEGVITIQRGKDSWNQRPQTSGSFTPPLTLAPRMRDPPPCALLPPSTHPLCSTPTTIIVSNTKPPSPYHVCYRVALAPSPPLHTPRAPPRILLAYKTPPPAPSTPHSLKAKHTPDKIPSAKSQATPFSTPSPLRS